MPKHQCPSNQKLLPRARLCALAFVLGVWHLHLGLNMSNWTILCDHLGNPLSLADRLSRARDYWTRFASLLRKNSVYPSDLVNLRHLYEYLGRAIPSDVHEAILRPDSSLRGLAFDCLAGDLRDRVDELPESLRAEYRRRRWIQLARQRRCSAEEFADGMMISGAD